MVRHFTVLFEDARGVLCTLQIKGDTVDHAMDYLARRNKRRRSSRKIALVVGVYEGGERVL